MMLGVTLNSMIRADGSPKYSMTTMLLGAALNTCLDPIFIFIFKMGVDGAATSNCNLLQILTFIECNLFEKFKSHRISICTSLIAILKRYHCRY